MSRTVETASEFVRVEVDSAIATIRPAAAATTFSRSIAPPAPLIARHCGSISSTPSIARSSAATLPMSITVMPAARAAAAVRSDVATAVTASPARTRSPSAAIANAAVLPVPSPTSIPVVTSATAASAAARFCSSGVSTSPPTGRAPAPWQRK